MLNKTTKRVLVAAVTALVVLSMVLIKSVGGSKPAPATSISEEAASDSGVAGPGKVVRQPTIVQAEPNRDTGALVSPRSEAAAVDNGPAGRPALAPLPDAGFLSAPPLTLPPTE